MVFHPAITFSALNNKSFTLTSYEIKIMFNVGP